MNWRHLHSQNGFNMTIKDYKTFLNSLPEEFDNFEITHREYTDITDNQLNAQEINVYSVHIDESKKKACNMHDKSYELYQEFVNNSNK
jgi:hypothetical protein